MIGTPLTLFQSYSDQELIGQACVGDCVICALLVEYHMQRFGYINTILCLDYCSRGYSNSLPHSRLSIIYAKLCRSWKPAVVPSQ
jgi:hypothetical protein